VLLLIRRNKQSTVLTFSFFSWDAYQQTVKKNEVKLSLCLINSELCHEDLRGSESIAPPFLTLALDGGECSASCPGRFTLGTHWMGSWVGPRTGLDAVEVRKIVPQPGIKPRPSSSWPVATPTPMRTASFSKVKSSTFSGVLYVWTLRLKPSLATVF
jgi:hypothetical protein